MKMDTDPKTDTDLLNECIATVLNEKRVKCTPTTIDMVARIMKGIADSSIMQHEGAGKMAYAYHVAASQQEHEIALAIGEAINRYRARKGFKSKFVIQDVGKVKVQ